MKIEDEKDETVENLEIQENEDLKEVINPKPKVHFEETEFKKQDTASLFQDANAAVNILNSHLAAGVPTSVTDAK
jgi:hypothetical protein